MVTLKKNTSSLGFGLVELIVSLSIVTIVTSIVMSRHNAFNGAILLRNQAYEVAFVIREAQQLAVSGTDTNNSTNRGKQRFGVAFSTVGSGTVNQKTLILYKDNNNSGNYSSQDTLLKTVRLDSRFNISRLVLGSPSSHVRVVFERPFFDAKFYQNNNDNSALIQGPLVITIVPADGSTGERTITVTTSGQVTVE